MRPRGRAAALHRINGGWGTMSATPVRLATFRRGSYRLAAWSLSSISNTPYFVPRAKRKEDESIFHRSGMDPGGGRGMMGPGGRK